MNEKRDGTQWPVWGEKVLSLASKNVRTCDKSQSHVPRPAGGSPGERRGDPDREGRGSARTNACGFRRGAALAFLLRIPLSFFLLLWKSPQRGGDNTWSCTPPPLPRSDLQLGGDPRAGGSGSKPHACKSLGSSGVSFISLSTQSRMRVRNHRLQPTAAAIQPYSSTPVWQHRAAWGQKSTSGGEGRARTAGCTAPAHPAPPPRFVRTNGVIGEPAFTKGCHTLCQVLPTRSLIHSPPGEGQRLFP